MKKMLLSILILLIISIAACKPAVKETKVTETGTSGDTTVDAVGNDLNNVDSVDKDLSTDELGDLDTGLNDVQNI